MQKSVFVIGGTGVMGKFLVEKLLSRGARVDAATLDDVKSEDAALRYYRQNFMDLRTLERFLSGRHYDAIVDFMTYSTAQLAERFELLLKSCGQYMFLSSYRVYADAELPTKEASPRILDITQDRELLQSDDYTVSKARQENIIRSSHFQNWTIVRPSITYSPRRTAFITLELPLLLRRAKKHQPVFLPEEALNVSATCTWAGDVAELMARLLFQRQALGECYSLCTAEHHTWGEIAQMYEKLLDVQFVPVPAQDYLSFFENSLSARVQLRYDRLMQREMDNRKVLLAAGMQQADFTPLAEGLSRVLAALPENADFPEAFQLWHVDAAMDAYAAAHPALI